MTSEVGAASTGVRGLLSGPVRRGRVVGVHRSCAYVLVGAELVALETADALGLPCAVRLGADRAQAPLAAVRRDDAAEVGDGVLRAGPVTVRVTRWWAPRLPRHGAPGERVAELAGLLEEHPCPVDVDAGVAELVGLGPGLTPAGDDVLAGLLVGLFHHPALRDPLAEEATALAPTRTNALSAALLRHAAAGHSVPAVADVADALAGHRRDLPAAVARLVAVGHSSGTALAHGLLRAARTVAARGPGEEAVA